MILENAKELDRRRVWYWLNDIYRDPTAAFYAYSNEQLIELAHDALVLLNEQEPKPKQVVRKQGKRENSDGSIDYFGEWYCPHCGKLLNRGFDLPWIEFCYKCGKALKWDKP